ncbi:serine threonine protein kinase CMGC group [Yamadazyma tenuis]|uniref:Kinase-like protein n=1 Tax=Candida tenuis (strain ATCC 10573 / BCRC 21748 / CBS 615 / JCM 9827 / NBRC 10315 / NRRL Y-1498 / VKM Y-70) TaxID=590646 RepID=G3B601_CANTC|nr:kinase-like protein [Yamadazyma tenuis ATCC 10573]EGV63345.1 kinase-like protein [Yamadazyma tenuis ATCC 10573]WEJ96832.1 serine threonine protein kinase CMGC group [Yamadazyma tenuis]
MSIITNRKRPRGFSESFDPNLGNSKPGSTGTSTTTNTSDVNSSMSSSSSYNDQVMFTGTNNPASNSNSTFSSTDSAMSKYLPKGHDYYHTVFEETEPLGDDDVDDDDEDAVDDDDDVIILEERNLNNYRIRAKRNNSDSVIFFDNDSFNAFKMLNVNNINNYTSDTMMDVAKKQRTNSLPQLPQVRCFYEKVAHLTNHKVGNIKAEVVPHNPHGPPCDDKDGHFIIELNSLFANRFIVLQLLGQGTFGKVVKCYDKLNRQHVAIKIIRNIPKYRDAAKIELRILATLKKYDNNNLNHCIHLRECFDYRGHICIVTDLLKISLYDYLENNKFIPFPGSHVQSISKQLIRSVAFLHDLNLIHTDLKPENILLYNDSFLKKPLQSSTLMSAYLHLSNSSDAKKVPKLSKILRDTSIQIIDFGSAIFDDEYHSSIVSTRHYRAPEIVLGCGWSSPCDLWSIGCILVELIIGEPLFKTHDNLEHLAMIEKFVGYPIDKSMVRRSKIAGNECGISFFTDENSINLDDCEESNDEEEDGDAIDDVIEDKYDDIDIDEEDNHLRLIFPSSSMPNQFVENVDQLTRIDEFISSRIGLKINFDFSLNYNYEQNKHLINFGNFTFWWFLIDLLKNLFIVNPKNRLTAQGAMDHPWFNLGIEDEGTI